MVTYTPGTLAALNAQRDYGANYAARTGYRTEVNRPFSTVQQEYAPGEDYAVRSNPLATFRQDDYEDRTVNPNRAIREDEARQLIESPVPYGSRFSAIFTPQDNRGQTAGVVRVNTDSTNPFRLYNGKELVFEGSGPDGAAQASRLAAELSKTGGSKADWSLQTQKPGGDWSTAAKDVPDRNIAGFLADIALPALGAILTPVTGGMSAAVAAGLGAAGGSALSGALQGRSIGKIATGAAISGLGAGIGSSLLGSAAGGIGNTASNGLSASFNAARGAGGSLLPSLGFGAGSGLAAGAGSLAGGLGADGIINVVASRLPASVLGTAPLAIGAGAAGGLGSLISNPSVGQPPQRAQQQTDPNEGPEIIAEAPRLPPTALGAAPIAIGGALGLGSLIQNVPNIDPNAPANKNSSVLDKIRAGLSLASLVGGALGGNGQGTGAANPGGTVSPNIDPIFSAQLPPSRYTQPNLAARPTGPTDWNRYAFGPEKSFFNYVPQNPQGYAEGGLAYSHGGDADLRSQFAVSGEGTGRSDDIEARLSDGEYVMDAETVALLGDGSNKAGAEVLDTLRVNLRKHKGRSLAQGEFSVKAKSPEAYMRGGQR